jgi:hypothetical protein
LPRARRRSRQRPNKKSQHPRTTTRCCSSSRPLSPSLKSCLGMTASQPTNFNHLSDRSKLITSSRKGAPRWMTSSQQKYSGWYATVFNCTWRIAPKPKTKRRSTAPSLISPLTSKRSSHVGPMSSSHRPSKQWTPHPTRSSREEGD